MVISAKSSRGDRTSAEERKDFLASLGAVESGVERLARAFIFSTSRHF